MEGGDRISLNFMNPKFEGEGAYDLKVFNRIPCTIHSDKKVKSTRGLHLHRVASIGPNNICHSQIASFAVAFEHLHL